MKIDVAIIGGGPAGLTAGIYVCRAGLSAICFERLGVGGQAALSYDIANYPGFKNISGFELTNLMAEQAKSCGLQIEFEAVKALTKTHGGFKIKTSKEEIIARKVILACGNEPRKLGLVNEEKFIGRGVSFCASCDGNFFKNKSVVVVGGGDTAMEDAVYLSALAKKVTVMNRTENFRAQPQELERVKKLKNVKIITNAAVTELIGNEQLEKIKIKVAGEAKTMQVDGLFVAIGHVPNLDFLKIDLNRDKSGYIIVDENMQTSEKNLYACGDIVSKKLKQVVTACADGAIAGNSCIGRK